ncbi:MAG: single-stranded DNA-binding protein [Anaerolineales bacterium]|nr:single-stranded DNA-binding protein [Anaerolineales bacterium]
MYQKIIIVGNLGSDPEMRYMADGTAVTNFSVATNRRWTNSQTGQPTDETTWFRVRVWGRQAETANQYLSRGRRVLIEGRLRPDPQTGGPRTYTRQDGTVGASFEITAENIQFLGGREDGMCGGNDGDYASGGSAVEEDEIPF